jgi:hypothetical protein
MNLLAKEMDIAIPIPTLRWVIIALLVAAVATATLLIALRRKR